MIELENKKEEKVKYLAKKFAMKEAISKALGTGILGFLKPYHIRIYNNKYGAPLVKLHNNFYSKRISLINQIEISVSDDYPVVVAFAMIFYKSSIF